MKSHFILQVLPSKYSSRTRLPGINILISRRGLIDRRRLLHLVGCPRRPGRTICFGKSPVVGEQDALWNYRSLASLSTCVIGRRGSPHRLPSSTCRPRLSHFTPGEAVMCRTALLLTLTGIFEEDVEDDNQAKASADASTDMLPIDLRGLILVRPRAWGGGGGGGCSR